MAVQVGLGAFALVINNKNQLLLARRNEDDKNHPFHLKWAIPGGGIEFGERPEETAIREVFEETAVRAEIVDKRPVVKSIVNKEHEKQTILLFYKARYLSGDNQHNYEPGTAETKWFAYEEIDFTECIPDLKELLDDMLSSK
jgi:8-oxo-dGTP diphosphatase